MDNVGMICPIEVLKGVNFLTQCIVWCVQETFSDELHGFGTRTQPVQSLVSILYSGLEVTKDLLSFMLWDESVHFARQTLTEQLDDDVSLVLEACCGVRTSWRRWW